MAKKKTGRRRRARPTMHGARDKIADLHMGSKRLLDCVYFSHEADTFLGLRYEGADKKAKEDLGTFHGQLAQLVRGMAQGRIVEVEVGDYFLEMQVPGGNRIMMSALLITHSEDMSDRMMCPQHVELTGRPEMITKTPMYFMESEPAEAVYILKFLKFAQEHVQGIDAARHALQAACPAALCVDLSAVKMQTYIFNVRVVCAHDKHARAVVAAHKAVSGVVDVDFSTNKVTQGDTERLKKPVKMACLRVTCLHETGKSWRHGCHMPLCMDKGDELVENLWNLYLDVVKAAVAARAAA